MTGASGIFNSTVFRNDFKRGIQADDRVLLQDDVAPQDKSRYVASKSTGGSSLEVQTSYSADYAGRNFIVGASLLGGHISGTTEKGNVATLTPGTSLTKDGLADIYVTYPANNNTINVGCGDVPGRDFRHLPRGSARVFTIAESSSTPGPLDLDPQYRYNNRATTIDEGRFCSPRFPGSASASSPTQS